MPQWLTSLTQSLCSSRVSPQHTLFDIIGRIIMADRLFRVADRIKIQGVGT